MTLLQWLVAALTAIFVAAVAFLQWRTAQQKAVLDLFDRRFKIYETVKTCVYEANRNAGYFNEEREREFLKVRDDAYFWFGNDIQDYLEDLRKELVKRDQSSNVANKFYEIGQPRFAKYMRFSQTVPTISRFEKFFLQ
jgi:hypothetical protein